MKDEPIVGITAAYACVCLVSFEIGMIACYMRCTAAAAVLAVWRPLYRSKDKKIRTKRCTVERFVDPLTQGHANY